MEKTSQAGNWLKLTMAERKAIFDRILPPDQWRTITDDEAPAGIEALARLVTKKVASQPSMVRRLITLTDGSGFGLTIEIPDDVLVGQKFYPDSGPPAFFARAFPMQFGIELLQSDHSPEAELNDRRRRYDEFCKIEQAKVDAKAAAARALQAEQARAEQERATYHGEDWGLLNALERFTIRLSLAIEKRDAELAGDLRALVAHSLAGQDDTAEAWPRAGWFEGLGLEGLSHERRQQLALEAEGERENAAMEAIPRDKLPALRAMAGNDRAAIIAHWTRIVAVTRKAGPEPKPYHDHGTAWTTSSY